MQNLKSTLGKVLRLSSTAQRPPATDNLFAAKGFNAVVCSYGHHNLLEIAFDMQGRLWKMEMW